MALTVLKGGASWGQGVWQIDPDSHLSGNFFVIICRWQLKADSAQGSLLCSPPTPAPVPAELWQHRSLPPALQTLSLRTLLIPGTRWACPGHAHLCDASVFNRSANFIILRWVFLPCFHLQEDQSPVIFFFSPLFTTGLCLNVIRFTPCQCFLFLESQTAKRQIREMLNNFAFPFCLFLSLQSPSRIS